MASTSARIATAGLSIGAVGAATLAYSLIEARSWRIRNVTVPVLPPGADPIVGLHLTDLHLTPNQKAKAAFVTSLRDLAPDFVIGTGDFLSHPEAVPTVVNALGPLLDLPGAFVLGSNDYFSPKPSNPLKYFTGPSKYNRRHTPDLPWQDLRSSLAVGGWQDLTNQRGTLQIRDLSVDLRGVDDPHIHRDDYSQVAGPYSASADLTFGVSHAPYRRVLDAMAADSTDLIFAGHTHGGQVCVPLYGALVTNCDIDRQRVKGLHHYDTSWMHVSAGVGTSPYTPVRLACPPEVTLLTLISKPTG